MPELPEVETVKKFLEKIFIGKKIFDIKLKNNKLRYQIPSKINKYFTNSIITKISRRGKYLIILSSNKKIILIHLGMTGFFRKKKKVDIRKHDHLIFFLEKDVVIYNDIRKFGFIKIYESKEFVNCSHLKNIGPEPLSHDFDKHYFKDRIISNRSIKSLLMDQKFVAGLGNIYCSEVLFEARINPYKTTLDLKDNEIENIIFSIKKILSRAIKFGGTSIKNFVVSDKKIGYFKNELKVYGREGKICLRCSRGHTILKVFQNGRSSFFCKNCQL